MNLGILNTDIRPVQSYIQFVSKSSAETLLPIIQKIVWPGNVIKTE